MYTLRISHKGRIVRWDQNTFTDMRPCEADGATEEITDLVAALNQGPALIDIIRTERTGEALIPKDLRETNDPLQWSLDKANEEARRVCQHSLDFHRSEDGRSFDLQLAKDTHDRYVKGDLIQSYPQLKLDVPKRERVYDRSTGTQKVVSKEAIGWGDEVVSDADNRTDREDGTASFKAKVVYFADPWGAECFNVAELRIVVEVVPVL